MSRGLPRVEYFWLPLLLAAVLAIYLPSLDNALVFDDGYLADGSLFAEYQSLLPVRTRMLSYGSFVWVQQVFGDGWWKQRLVNVAIHIAVVMALWGLYREILRHIAMPAPDPGSTVAAMRYEDSPALGVAIAFFALNPVAVYAVGYLIQRSILLATLFVVLGLWLFARGLAAKKPRMHALALLCYVLAVMAKEPAILAPLAAVPLYIVIARPSARRLALVATAGGILVAAAAAVLTLRYGEIIGKPFDEYSQVYLAQLAKLSPDAEKHAYGLSILNQAYLFFHYGLRWFLPYEGWLSINLRPPFPITWLTFPHVLGVIGYVAVLAAGFHLVIRHRDWRALMGLSILIPVLLFATEFVTVWVQDPFVLYRSYLWAIGIPGVIFFLVHGPKPPVVGAIGAALAALLIWQALDRVMSMSTPEEAYSDAIAKLPNDPRSVGRWFPYLNRGNAYLDRNQFQLAMADFQLSAALDDMGMGTFNLGALLAGQGRHAEALAAFAKAEKEGYNLYNLPFQKGQSLAATGKVAEAADQLRRALQMNPPSPLREIVLLQLGRAEIQLGKPGEAGNHLRALLAVEPGNREGKYALAMAYIMTNDHGKARELLDSLLGDAPTARVYYARAMANYGLKRKADALADIDKAIRIAPDNPLLQQWRNRIQAMP